MAVTEISDFVGQFWDSGLGGNGTVSGGWLLLFWRTTKIPGRLVL
jgi:hypothetical protein